MTSVSIVRENPYQTTYEHYGDPPRLAEFRVFSLNKCEMGCKGCFYNKLNNDFNDFASMYQLALDLRKHDYQLETLYLLPTELFENEVNYDLFKNEDVRATLGMFNYVGIAATLEAGYDPVFFDTVFAISSKLRVELQVNLLIKRLFEPEYVEHLQRELVGLKQRYGSRLVTNLAINTGFNITDAELAQIGYLLNVLSEDAIVELNFTFLFNEAIHHDKKRKMLRVAFDQVTHFKELYKQHRSYRRQYNDRTFYRKPSFAFVGSPGRIYANPILPFDEYVFIEDAKYLLSEPTVEAFQTVVAESDLQNLPHLDACGDCESLAYCMGKHYFAIANYYRLGCFEPKDENQTIEAGVKNTTRTFKIHLVE